MTREEFIEKAIDLMDLNQDKFIGTNEANLMAAEEIADVTFDLIKEKDSEIERLKEDKNILEKNYVTLQKVSINRKENIEEQSSLLEEMAELLNYIKYNSLNTKEKDITVVYKGIEIALNKYNQFKQKG